jgi:hypothetical protein
MKKIIKITLWSIVGCIVAFILYLNYQTHFSEAARNGKTNIENIKKGMEENIVIKIMGNPDIIEYCDLDSTSKAYSYNTNEESFIHVTVCFDSTMTVKEIYYPKE